MFVYRRHCIGEKRRDQVAARTATRSKRQRTRLAADFYQHICIPAPLHRREAEGSSCSEDGDEKQTAKNSISCRLLSTCLCIKLEIGHLHPSYQFSCALMQAHARLIGFIGAAPASIRRCLTRHASPL
ncbi:uncharacterized protein LOC135816155 [Sycon ciliatum]|uniref:uncharacterized protein LOC135816155 n=1 Tax=Sycon ciliatum TaxID=27933 RepID=UPI0031F5F424